MSISIHIHVVNFHYFRMPKSLIGNLHSDENYKRFEELGASPYVLDILKHGLHIDFMNKGDIYKCSRDNNMSVQTNMDKVIPIVNKWIDKGFVKAVPPSFAKVILPLSLAERLDHETDLYKERVCLDASELNEHIELPKTKLSDLEYITPKLKQFRRLGVIDISNYYMHVRLHPETSRYLCFKLDLGDGKGPQVFTFLVLPYGVNIATFVMNEIMKPILRYISRKVGIDIWAYVDDFLSQVSCDKVRADQQFDLAIAILRLHGFDINNKKVRRPDTTQKFLGFVLDTGNMTMSLDSNKLKELHRLLKVLPQGKHQIRIIAKICGKLLNLGRASRVPIAPFLTESAAFMMNVVKDSTVPQFWNREVYVPWPVINELKACVQDIPQWTGRSLCQPENLITFVPEDDFYQDCVIWAGDGNQESGVSYCVHAQENCQFTFFDVSQQLLSSSARELQVLFNLLVSGKIPNDVKFTYVTDSMVLQHWIEKGSIQMRYSDNLRRLFLEAYNRNITLHCAWSNRSNMIIDIADQSCRSSTDEYSLRPEDDQYIAKHFQQEFTLDPFASSYLFKVDRFYTAKPVLNSLASPGELADWENNLLYIFPPRHKYHEALYKIDHLETGAGVLILLCNHENVLGHTWLRDTYHFPSYVRKVSRHRIRLRSPFMDTKFIRGQHLIWIIFFAKDLQNNNLSQRCSLEPGHCAICPGNPNAVISETEYYTMDRKLPDVPNRRY